MSDLVPAEEVIEGVVVEHEGFPFGNRSLFGWDLTRDSSASAHFIMQEDGTITQVVHTEGEWR